MATDQPFASDQDDETADCHHDVLHPEGAKNPVCWKCGEINPHGEKE